MPALPSKRSTKWALYAVLAAGLAVVVMGFLTGAFIFGISIAAGILIWLIGGWYVKHRQKTHDAEVRREVEAQRRADAAPVDATAESRDRTP